MPISRIARTHLLYQFVILTLLFLGIGYYELLLQKKCILFLALVPMFFYQLLILSCCTELLPIPRWMNPSDVREDVSESRPEDLAESPENPPPEENTDRSNTTSAISPSSENQNVRPRVYKLRNWRKSNGDLNNVELTSPRVSFDTYNISSAEKFEFATTNDEDGLQRSDLTKRYYFPYRQKRLEPWITSKENARPYKIRNRESNIEEQNESQSITNGLEEASCKNSSEHSDSENGANKESKFTKSYSFPFRQKRMEPCTEQDIIEETVETPSMPYWKSIEYSTNAKSKARRCRRAVSTANLPSQQLDLINNDKQREFSQSMEISNSPEDLYSDSKKSAPKTSGVCFSKLKLGIVNCFSKMKKDNSKTNLDKKDTENKLRLFKNLFQSRENLNSPLRDECSSLKAKEKEPRSCCHEYISFDKYNFDNDVTNRILELSNT